MVPRWRFLATFLRPVFSASRVQHVSDLHLKFTLRPHHKYGRHSICSGWDSVRKKKKKKEQITAWKYNGHHEKHDRYSILHSEDTKNTTQQKNVNTCDIIIAQSTATTDVHKYSFARLGLTNNVTSKQAGTRTTSLGVVIVNHKQTKLPRLCFSNEMHPSMHAAVV